MKLSCIGCGPGDPDLLTIKAVNRLREAEIIFAPTSKHGKPSIALSIVSKYINALTTSTVDLIFPMTKDKDLLIEQWKQNADRLAGAVLEGKNTVYLTVGDPSLYSTWIYMQREIIKNYGNIEIEIIPGIPSMFAFAAGAKMSLAEGDETLGIVPACYDLERVKRTASSCDTVIFLKDGRYFDNVIQTLSESGFDDESIITIAQDVTSEGEIMKIARLGELKKLKIQSGKYFSIMVAKRNDKNQ
ncbi:MAG TPA: precorrin-2 C(20)-methyltransferase [Nitrososphaeraceae archaeon]|jgi:precorrin-2/cobalt-factor-2 C20-methyltransferase